MANFFRGFGLPNSNQPQDGADPLNHWKRQIGFSEEPVQDAQGYWTLGYGQRLNDTPGGPRPYALIAEPIASDELSYFMEQGGDPSSRVGPPQIDEPGDNGCAIPSNPNRPPGERPSIQIGGQRVTIQPGFPTNGCDLPQDEADAIAAELGPPNNSRGRGILDDIVDALSGKLNRPPKRYVPPGGGIRG